jgi:hypothetical protein
LLQDHIAGKDIRKTDIRLAECGSSQQGEQAKESHARESFIRLKLLLIDELKKAPDGAFCRECVSRKNNAFPA